MARIDRSIAIRAGLPSLLAIVAGIHRFGALLAVVLFALWCGRLRPEERSSAVA